MTIKPQMEMVPLLVFKNPESQQDGKLEHKHIKNTFFW